MTSPTTATTGRDPQRRATGMRALGATIASAGLVAALAPLTPAAAAEGHATSLQQLGACVSAKHKLSVMLLMDETESLIHEVSGGQIHADRPGSDPDGARVKAAENFISQLLIKEQDESFDTSIRIAGFGQNYNADESTYGTWMPLTKKTAPEIVRILSGEKDRVEEQYTNYANALSGALGDFSRNAEQNDCKLLVTFTDGALTAEGPPSADAEAERRICADGGIADQLRAARITNVGIGLSQKNNPSDFSLLKGMTAGTGTHCGSMPADGAFFPANSVGGMFASFRQALGTAGTSTGDVAAKDAAVFVLDDSITAVRVTAIAREWLGDTASALLTAPNGQTLRLGGEGEDTINGAKVAWTSINDAVQEVDSTMILEPGQSWAGPWKIQYTDIDPTMAESKVFTMVRIQPDLSVALDAVGNGVTSTDEGLQLRSDDQLQVTVVDKEGKPRPLAGTAKLDATFIPADGSRPIPLTRGAEIRSGGPLALPLDNIKHYPANGRVDASVTITTKGIGDERGTTLEPIVTSKSVAIAQLDMPSVASEVTAKIDDTTTRVEIPVSGPGIVWVPGGVATLSTSPDGLGSVGVRSEHSSPDTALKLAQGENATLAVDLTIDPLVDGPIVGTLPIMGAKADGSGATNYPVTLRGSITVPVNAAKFTIGLIIALILAIGIPLLLLYLIRYVTARPPRHALRYYEVPATFDQDSSTLQISATDANWLRRLTLGEQAVTTNYVVTSGNRLRAGSTSLSVVRFLLNPVAAAHMRVDNPLSASPWGTSKGAAKLPLSVYNSWFIIRDPRDASTMTVVILTENHISPDTCDSLQQSIDQRAANVAAVLASKPVESDPAASVASSDGWTTVPTSQPDPSGPTTGWDDGSTPVAQPQPPAPTGWDTPMAPPTPTTPHTPSPPTGGGWDRPLPPNGPQPPQGPGGYGPQPPRPTDGW